MEIQLDQVSVELRRGGPRVLDGVDLHLRRGEQVALVGPSGAGKTTLLRVLLGAVRPKSGVVRVGGHDPYRSRAARTAVRRRSGFIRQRDDLVCGVSARTNILMSDSHRWRWWEWATIATGRLPSRYADRVRDLADRHGVAELLETKVEDLSGGQRQRVALLRALLPEPALLLADETTSGLDPARAATVVGHLRRAGGATLLLTTHDLRIAREFPRIVALRDGRVVADAPRLDRATVEQIYAPAAVADAPVGPPW